MLFDSLKVKSVGAGLIWLKLSKSLVDHFISIDRKNIQFGLWSDRCIKPAVVCFLFDDCQHLCFGFASLYNNKPRPSIDIIFIYF